MSSDPELIYKIALSMIPGIGSVTARKILSYTGSPEGVFRENQRSLEKIPGVGELMARKVVEAEVLDKAGTEIEFINKHGILPVCYQDKAYPERLKHCPDAPLILYYKGTVGLNEKKVISIVGTRNPTTYGLETCRSLVTELVKRNHKVVIISGLAYGVDVCAHKAALNNHLPTVAVLGHGMQYIYPAIHKNVAGKIVNQGALVTDFASFEKPERNNFIKRNRIIAGLSDATIVIESGIKGGALITADIANSYNRDVFAVPGRIGDTYSEGCNQLIKQHKASLLENCSDLEYIMGWDRNTDTPSGIQKELFHNLSDEEEKIVGILSENNELSVDVICLKADMPVSRVSALLLNLEFAGLVHSLPGNMYKLYR